MHDNGKRPRKIPGLAPDQRKALAEAVTARDLRAEIAFLRLKARALMDDPDADPRVFIRAMEILIRLIRIDARMRYNRC